MSELLPCPFCGGEGEVIPAEPNEVTRVHCTRCDAEASPRTDEDEAIYAWNTRVRDSGWEAVALYWQRMYKETVQDERTTTMTTDAGSQHWYSCDTCGCDGYAAKLPNYCPSCGAKVVRYE